MSGITVMSTEFRGDKVSLVKTDNVITPYLVATHYKNHHIREVKCISLLHGSWIYELCVNNANRPALHGRIISEVGQA